MARQQMRDHGRPRHGTADDTPGRAGDEAGDDDAASASGEGASLLARRDDGAGTGDGQAEFLEQFDEDLYRDREDRPAQGNTADVAMEHRFGSDADAYSEYAWRRPGDHHRGDASAVGQARDPADVADEDDTTRDKPANNSHR